jgi:hypothetical protein
VPIGRLRTSGPDSAPRQYSDAGLGAWFSADPSPAGDTDEAHDTKTSGRPASAAGAGSAAPDPTDSAHATNGNPASTTTSARAGYGNAGTAAGSHAANDHAGPDAADTRAADPRTRADSRTAAGAAETFAADGRSDTGDTADEKNSGSDPDDNGSGVVIDFDLTGLLNGSGVTAEQAITVSRRTSSAPDHTSAPSNPDRAGAPSNPDHAGAPAEPDSAVPGTEARPGPAAAQPPQPSLAPGPEPREAQAPVRPLKPLAAVDLEAIRWRLDGGTLREVVDDRDALRELGARLDEPLAGEADNISRSGLLSVRAEVYRLLDELGMAAAASRLALSHAETAGDVQSIVIAQAELAHVLRLRGDFGEADRLFEEAASSDSPEVLRSIVHENAGRSCFDQGRHMEALDHFARAIRLGRPDDLDLVERIDVSLEAVYIHVLRDGWGPYPRLRRDIIDPPRRGAAPQPNPAR